LFRTLTTKRKTRKKATGTPISTVFNFPAIHKIATNAPLQMSCFYNTKNFCLIAKVWHNHYLS